MRIHFLHQTHYRYEKPVVLLPQTLRMRPREDGFQKLLSYRCSIQPPEHRLSSILDSEGNVVQRAWFERPLTRLDIRVEGVVETLLQNPFDFMLETDALALPLQGLSRRWPALAPSLEPGSPELSGLASELLQEAQGGTLAYVSAALKRLSTQFRRKLRLVGEPWAAAETLRQGEGSCRDLAVLFIDLCRHQGLAARFVSGYYLENPERSQHDLHAWAEVFLPGAGWKGFDPTCGLACSDTHVPLCAAAHSADCAPVEGLFSGSPGSFFESIVELKGQA
jgi:transglutaminase-like putative cysteine protease